MTVSPLSKDELLRHAAAAAAGDPPVTFSVPASPASITKVQAALGVPLPPSYCTFLACLGAGGIPDGEISGIYDDDPLLEAGGAVVADTLRLRERLRLPHHLVVVQRGDDLVPHCLDTSRPSVDGECPVIAFDRGRIVKSAPDFSSFARIYFEVVAEPLGS